MTVASRDNTRRKRAEQTGTLVGVRLQPDQLAAVDRWAASEDDAPSRPEAVRRLVTRGLKA